MRSNASARNDFERSALSVLRHRLDAGSSSDLAQPPRKNGATAGGPLSGHRAAVCCGNTLLTSIRSSGPCGAQAPPAPGRAHIGGSIANSDWTPSTASLGGLACERAWRPTAAIVPRLSRASQSWPFTARATARYAAVTSPETVCAAALSGNTVVARAAWGMRR
jgi:hypothetical protein